MKLMPVVVVVYHRLHRLDYVEQQDDRIRRADVKKSVLAVIGGIVLASVIIGVLCILGFGAWFGIQ